MHSKRLNIYTPIPLSMNSILAPWEASLREKLLD